MMFANALGGVHVLGVNPANVKLTELSSLWSETHNGSHPTERVVVEG